MKLSSTLAVVCLAPALVSSLGLLRDGDHAPDHGGGHHHHGGSMGIPGISNLLLMDIFATDPYYYYYGSGGRLHDLLPLALLGGFGDGPFGTGAENILFEEYLLFDSFTSGHHEEPDLIPYMLFGAAGGMDNFETMALLHERDIAKHYDQDWFGGDPLASILAFTNPEFRTQMHDLHAVQRVFQHADGTNGANLVPLLFAGDQDEMMEGFHQYHFLQEWRNTHNDMIPLGLLGGGTGMFFDDVHPIANYWAIDQVINGEHYYLDHHDEHDHGGSHGGHGDDSHGSHGGRGHGSHGHGSHGGHGLGSHGHGSHGGHGHGSHGSHGGHGSVHHGAVVYTVPAPRAPVAVVAPSAHSPYNTHYPRTATRATYGRAVGGHTVYAG